MAAMAAMAERSMILTFINVYQRSHERSANAIDVHNGYIIEMLAIVVLLHVNCFN